MNEPGDPRAGRRADGRALRWLSFVAAAVGVLGACGIVKKDRDAGTDTAVDRVADRNDGRVEGDADAAPFDASTESVAGDGGDASAGEAGETGTPTVHVIAVTTTEAGIRADGLCGLEEAIAAVSGGDGGQPASRDCPAGTGHDVIQLAAGTYAVAAALELAKGVGSGVGSAVELRGVGLAETTIAIPQAARGCGLTVTAADQTVKITGLTLAPASPSSSSSSSSSVTGACVGAGNLWLRHVRVTGFSAGGLRAEGSDAGLAKLTVFNSLVDGNRSAGDGAGIAFVGAASGLYVEESAIVGNVSDGQGGGVFGSGGGLNTIKNSTLSGNRARRGGGIALAIQDGGYMALYSATIADNHATEVGGGVFQQAPDGTSVNTILNGDLISGNHADGDVAQDNLNADWGSNFTCTLSLLSIAALPRQPPNVSSSCLYTVADAKLGPLMSMGGKDGLPVHPLLPGSAAIDAIDATGSGEITQQRDTWNASAGDPQIGLGPDDTPPWTLFGRPLDGDGDGVANEDMGAYEVNLRWEAELLAVAQVSGGTNDVVPAPGSFSHGAGARFSAGGMGAAVVYVVPVAEAGSYDVTAQMKTGTDAGRFQLAVAEAAGGPFVAAGAEQDGYAGTDGWLSFTASTVSISGPGPKYFRLTVTGKNAASSGYSVTTDYFVLVKR